MRVLTSPLLIIALGGIILTAGDIVLKFWVEKHHSGFYVAGLLFYMLGAMLLVESYKSQNIAIASALFIICNLVTLSLVSWLYFGEPLAARKVIGLVVSFIAVIFMV